MPLIPPLFSHLSRCALAFSGALLSLPSHAAPEPAGRHTLFTNANIVDMEDGGSSVPRPGQVLVRDGDIIAISSAAAMATWLKQKNVRPATIIDLNGDILMPGFIEPHAHLANMAQMGQLADISPCWPAKFEKRPTYKKGSPDNAAACPLYIHDAIAMVYDPDNAKSKKGPWIAGNGIDPSRMTTVANATPQQTEDFVNKPAAYFAQYFPAQKPPLFLLDQSGHVAYVNRQALQTVFGAHCTSDSKCPGLPETTITSTGYQPADPAAKYDYTCSADKAVCNYTGRLLEPGSYTAFLIAMQAGLQPGQWMFNETQDQFVLETKPLANAVARAGVTTFVNGGALNLAEVNNLSALLNTTWQGADNTTRRAPLRVISLLAWNAGGTKPTDPPQTSQQLISKGLDIWKQPGQRFGVQGVKLWADGSTQGCSAALSMNYDKKGMCASAGMGHVNYPVTQIQANLQPFWDAGWYINVHANGDLAIQNTIDALSALGGGCATAKNSGACGKMHTLIHFTVEGTGTPQNQAVPTQVANVVALRAKKVDLSASLLIGHVAYWGAAFQTILDGVPKEQQNNASDPHGRVAQLDGARSLSQSKVPFSLHSDAPVSPTVPLWLAEQAVTRNTWVYPNLKTGKDSQAITMPGAQNVTFDEALRAITVVPAKQHQLFDRIGSIRVGKKADFVRLGKDSYAAARRDPANISAIEVVGTYLDGMPVDYFPVAQ